MDILPFAVTACRSVVWVTAAAVAMLCVAAPASAQIHTAHDHLPDFCAGAASWTDGLPGRGAVVRVPAGQTVSLEQAMEDAPAVLCVSGALRLQDGARLLAGTIVVESGGLLEAGTPDRPVRADIVIADQPLDVAADPARWGTGLIVAGALHLHGQPMLTWTRLAREPHAGDTSLEISDDPMGWTAGQRLVLPDTRHLTDADRAGGWAPTAPQWEELLVAAVNGRTIELSAPLRFDHAGARGRDGQVEFLPHVGNLSRSVVVRSADAAQVVRGHVAATGKADIDVRYTRFADLGRTTIDPINTSTNFIGRYPLHMHHLIGSAQPGGYQFRLIGNAIDGGSEPHRRKWGIVIHDSHYGLIQNNVVYNASGSAYMFEDGSESYNVLDGNFAVRSTGIGDRLAPGTEGGGFWFRGFNNYVRNNVAANLWGNEPEAAYGFKYYARYLGDIRVPKFPGADTSVDGEYETRDGNAMPVLEFNNNETYGAAQGVTYWWIGTQDPERRPGYAQVSTFKDTRIWAVFNIGVYHYPAADLVFDGLVMRGIGQAGACCKLGWYGGDYAQHDVTIRHADIFNVPTAISVSSVAYGTQVIEDSTVDSIRTTPLYSVNGGSWIPPRTVIVRRTSAHINKAWDYDPGMAARFNTTQSDVTKVYAHKGDAGVNFQAFYAQQAAQDIAGGRVSGTTTRTDVTGIVQAIPPEAVAQAAGVAGAVRPAGRTAQPSDTPSPHSAPELTGGLVLASHGIGTPTLAACGASVHLAYGDGAVYYRQSADDGTAWTESQQLGEGRIADRAAMACDGPRVVLAVIRGTDAWLWESRDSGQSWLSPVKLSERGGVGQAVAALRGERVTLAWLERVGTGGAWQVVTRQSADGGTQWGPAEALGEIGPATAVTPRLSLALDGETVLWTTASGALAVRRHEAGAWLVSGLEAPAPTAASGAVMLTRTSPAGPFVVHAPSGLVARAAPSSVGIAHTDVRVAVAWVRSPDTLVSMSGDDGLTWFDGRAAGKAVVSAALAWSKQALHMAMVDADGALMYARVSMP